MSYGCIQHFVRESRKISPSQDNVRRLRALALSRLLKSPENFYRTSNIEEQDQLSCLKISKYPNNVGWRNSFGLSKMDSNVTMEKKI